MENKKELTNTDLNLVSGGAVSVEDLQKYYQTHGTRVSLPFNVDGKGHWGCLKCGRALTSYTPGKGTDLFMHDLNDWCHQQYIHFGNLNEWYEDLGI